MNNWCTDCGKEIGWDKKGPSEGWELEDGRIVCHTCCIKDTGRIINLLKKECRRLEDSEK